MTNTTPPRATQSRAAEGCEPMEVPASVSNAPSTMKLQPELQERPGRQIGEDQLQSAYQDGHDGQPASATATRSKVSSSPLWLARFTVRHLHAAT